jgi:hypothetical protein
LPKSLFFVSEAAGSPREFIRIRVGEEGRPHIVQNKGFSLNYIRHDRAMLGVIKHFVAVREAGAKRDPLPTNKKRFRGGRADRWLRPLDIDKEPNAPAITTRSRSKWTIPPPQERRITGVHGLFPH